MSLLDNDAIRQVTSLPYVIGEEVPPSLGVMEVIDARAGDLKITWDPAKPAEVDAAFETFDALTKKGYAAFALEENGQKGEKLSSFNVNARRIVFVAPVMGG